jgi:formate dehydrogenase subunit delta
MDAHHLIHMANRIGQFFESYSDRSEALDGVATHIRKFWDPRMRRQLLLALDAATDTGLSPLVSEALHRHRDTLV